MQFVGGAGRVPNRYPPPINMEAKEGHIERIVLRGAPLPFNVNLEECT